MVMWLCDLASWHMADNMRGHSFGDTT